MSELEDKVEEPGQSNKDKDKLIRRHSGHSIHDTLTRPVLLIIWIGEESHSKGTGNIFKRFMTENFPELGNNMKIP